MNDAPQELTIPVTKTVIYDQFSYEIKDLPQMNRRDVIIISPAGERVILPFHDVDAAISFGQKMISPMIEVPRSTIER